MTGLVVWTVIDVLLLIAGLAFYLFWVGTLLTRIAGNLEECAETVRTIVGHAKLIGPGVEHINETGGVVAHAVMISREYGIPCVAHLARACDTIPDGATIRIQLKGDELVVTHDDPQPPTNTVA